MRMLMQQQQQQQQGQQPQKVLAQPLPAYLSVLASVSSAGTVASPALGSLLVVRMQYLDLASTD